LQPKVDFLATTSVHLRIWPNDLDFNLHVNNGRYLTLADIGRIDWFIRSGVLRTARRYQAFPVVADAVAKFRRELNVFEKVEIQTRLVGWDHKWAFLEHRFVRAERVVGVVAIRGVFKGLDGPLDPQVFVRDHAVGVAAPELPMWAQHFHQSAELMSAMLRQEERSRGVGGLTSESRDA
jgi:acyl-CoA thioesterase FadM